MEKVRNENKLVDRNRLCEERDQKIRLEVIRNMIYEWRGTKQRNINEI